jgi:DNA-binding NarL/FixJ family response regulator
MHVVIVGNGAERARLRAILPDTVHIVGEASTLADARRDRHGADAWLMIPPADDGPVEPDTLTPRERQVLELMAEGLPNKAIASRLAISDQTVKFHVASIHGKLGASNRTDAVRLALRRGLLSI